MDKQSRKSLQKKYQERLQVGGVYAIVHKKDEKKLLLSTEDIAGSKNRFIFSQQTGGCFHHKLANLWKEDGPQAFRFEVIEELEKRPEQTGNEFREELVSLFEMTKDRVRDELI